MDRSVDTGVQGYMTASNPIYGNVGSIILWTSCSTFFGENIEPVFWAGGLRDIRYAATLTGNIFKPDNMEYAVDNALACTAFGQWHLVVLTQNSLAAKAYTNTLLCFSGSNRPLTGTVNFFDNVGYMGNESPPPDYYSFYIKLGFANIAFTNRELSAAQVTALYNAGVTANYRDVLGFTPEAYWKGPSISGTPYYVPNEVY